MTDGFNEVINVQEKLHVYSQARDRQQSGSAHFRVNVICIFYTAIIDYLECLYQYKDVVYTNSQNQERDDLDNDERGSHPTVTEQTKRGGYREQDNQYSGQTQGNLGIHLLT